MITTTRLGLGITGVALVEGVVGNALLHTAPGINVLLFLGTLLVALLLLTRRRGMPMAGADRWLVLPVVLLAMALAWRDSPPLQFVDLLGLLLILALAALRPRTEELLTAGSLEYGLRVCAGAASVLWGPILLAGKDIAWQEIPRGRWSTAALSVGRGVLLTVPLLLLFGALFMAADAGFERLVFDLFAINIPDLLGQVMLSAVLAWATGGLLRTRLLAGAYRPSPITPPATLPLGAIEIGTALGALNALFLAFVLVQFRYFFGGGELVFSSAGLTYAEYARRGFFELVAVAALVLPLLLLSHWLWPKTNRRQGQLFGALAGTLVVLLFVIMASAMHRMLLYQSVYGLTELRLYVTAFTGWLAVVCAWFVLTVLRGRRQYFAAGALMAGIVGIVALHLLNPDNLITGTNLRLLARTGRFDGAYAAALSADAVPALVLAAPALPEPHRQLVARRLLERWTSPPRRDWRSWNWSRARAWRLVAEHREALQAAAGNWPGEGEGRRPPPGPGRNRPDH